MGDVPVLPVGENDAGAQAHLRSVLAEARIPPEARLWMHRGKSRHVIAQIVNRHEIDLVIAGMLNPLMRAANGLRALPPLVPSITVL